MDKMILRTFVRGAYDVQKLRIQTGNRIVANFKTQLGQAPGTKEDELSDEAKSILDNFRAEYDLIADAIISDGVQRAYCDHDHLELHQGRLTSKGYLDTWLC